MNHLYHILETATGALISLYLWDKWTHLRRRLRPQYLKPQRMELLVRPMSSDPIPNSREVGQA